MFLPNPIFLQNTKREGVGFISHVVSETAIFMMDMKNLISKKYFLIQWVNEVNESQWVSHHSQIPYVFLFFYAYSQLKS